jgi:hypothetical protein
MTSKKGHLFALVCFAALLLALPRAWGQAHTEANGASADPAKAFRVREGFHAPLSLKTKQGKTISLNVAVQKWSIDGTLGPQTIRVDNFTIFQMRSGKIQTQADGKDVIKTADDFWTMPAGSTLIFKVKGETALLEVVTVSTK